MRYWTVRLFLELARHIEDHDNLGRTYKLRGNHFAVMTCGRFDDPICGYES